MRRLLLICGFAVLTPGLWSADAVPPPAATATPLTYAFAVGTTRHYAYSVKQTVGWDSAGDQLTYTSTLTWKFLLTVMEAAPERSVLSATILRVQATHDGPGSRRLVDSGAKGDESGHDDPLLGHLLALDGAILSVTVDPRSGQVSAVQGGDAIVARINKRAPATTPGDPPPLDAAARAAFSSEALGRIWSQLLALPSATPTPVPLGPPLGGTVERVWQGSTYTLRLPAGGERLSTTLVGDPTPVSAVLSDLRGTGGTSVGGDGMPGAGKGELTFQVTFQALTQPVVQRHTLAWELTPLTLR